MANCNHCGKTAFTRICPRCRRVIKSDPAADGIGCLVMICIFVFAYFHNACGK